MEVIKGTRNLEFSDIEDIVEEYEDNIFVYDIEMKNYHYFLANNIMTHNCCFDGNEKVLINDDGIHVISFKDLYNENDNKEKFVYHNGSWKKGNVIRLPKRPMYEITTTNNKKIIVTDNHINVTDSGNKESWQLTTDDYLMFSNISLQGNNENNLTYNHGYVIGAFLGNGSFGTRHKDGTIYEINFIMNKKNYELVYNALSDISEKNVQLSSVYNNVYPVRISDKNLVAFIQRYTSWTEGTKAHTKKLNLDCLLESVEFRRGILNGWYDTDGGNSNRCYTTSKELAESMEVLITSLGMHSIINISDRTNETCIIREIEYKKNYPLYCVRWYSPNDRRSMKNIYKVINNSMFFKIKSIKKVEATSEWVYCFEMKDTKEPYFTLPNGIITHNCRLRNAIEESTDFSYSLGAGGIETGSHSVMTIDLVALFGRGYDLEDIIKKVHKFQYAHRMLIQDGIDAGLLPAYSAGFIHLDKQFSTLGVNGLNELAEEKGLTVGNNKEYKEFVSEILGTFKRLNMEARKLYNGAKYNTELVPSL